MPVGSEALLTFRGNIRDVVQKINTVGNKLKDLDQRVQSTSQRMVQANRKGANSWTRMRQAVTNVNMVFNRLTNSFRLVTQGITNVGRAVMFFVGLPLIAFLTAGFRTAIDYEDALVRVQKTTNLTNQQMQRLSNGLRTLARSTTSSHIELAEMAEQLGQLGVRSVPAIQQYIKVFDMAATATDIGADTIARDVGRIAAAFGRDLDKSAGDIEKLLNVINMLENTTAASASEIVKAMSTAAESASLLEISMRDTAAMSAVLVGAGLSAEQAGTALRNMYIHVTRNADVVAELMANTEKYSSTEQVLNAIRDDSVGVMRDIIAAMGEEDDTARKLLATFEMANIRGGRALAKLATGSDALNRALQMSNAEWEKATSLVAEYERALLSTKSHLKVLRNNLNDAAITLANTFLPIINRVIEYAIPGIRLLAEAFERLPHRTKMLVGASMLLLAVFGPLLFFLGQIAHGLSLFGLGITMLVPAITTIIGLIGSFIAGLLTLNPVMIAVAAGIAGGATVILGVLQRIGVDVAGFFENLANRAAAWGENLAVTYGEGLVAGAARAVAAAVEWIGNLIANFLRAFSPPKEGPLSHIDKWGKTLIDTYLQSFAQADFSILSKIGNTIGKVLSNLEIVGKIGEGQQFSFLAQARENLARLIKIFNETGKISESVLGKIVSRLGEAKDEIADLIKAQLEYNKLQKELAEIESRRDDVNDSFREEVRLIAESNMSAEEKAEAIRRAKLERDGELRQLAKEEEALEEQSEKAKEKLDWQQALVDAMLDQDSIQAQMVKALEKAAGAASSLGEKLSGFKFPEVPDLEEAFGGLGDTLEDILTLDERIQSAKDGWNAFTKGLRGEEIGLKQLRFKDEGTQKEMLKLNDIGLTIHDTWEKVKTVFDEVSSVIEGIPEKISGAFSEAGEIPAISGILDALGRFSNWVNNTWPTVLAVILTGWEILKAIFKSAADVIGPAVGELIDTFSELGIEFEMPDLEGVLTLLKNLGIGIATLVGWIIASAASLITGLVNAFTTAIQWSHQFVFGFISALGILWEGVVQVFTGVIDFLVGFWHFLNNDLTPEAGERLKRGFNNIFMGLVNIILGAFLFVFNWLAAMVTTILGLVFGFVEGVIQFFINLYDELVGNSIIIDLFTDMYTAFLEGLGEVTSLVGQWIEDRIKDFVDFGKGIVQGIVDGIKNLKSTLMDVVQGLVNDLIKKIEPWIDVLNRIPGISISLPNTGGSGGDSGDDDTPTGIGHASGGITLRPHRAIVGEGGEPEVIAPLSKLPDLFRQTFGASAVDGGGNININLEINNPIVRSDDDIRELAMAVKDVIEEEVGDRLRFGGSIT